MRVPGCRTWGRATLQQSRAGQEGGPSAGALASRTHHSLSCPGQADTDLNVLRATVARNAPAESPQQPSPSCYLPQVEMEAQRASLAQGHTAVESEPRHTQSPNSLTPVFHTNADACFHSPFSSLGAPGDLSGLRQQRPEKGEPPGRGRGGCTDTSEVTRSPCTVLLLPRSDWQMGPPKHVWRAHRYRSQIPGTGEGRAHWAWPGPV